MVPKAKRRKRAPRRQRLDALDAAGLTGTTRVIYTSDHGDNVGHRGLWGKSNLYRESVAIPMLILGALLSARAESLLGSLERGALHVLNVASLQRNPAPVEEVEPAPTPMAAPVQAEAEPVATTALLSPQSASAPTPEAA